MAGLLFGGSPAWGLEIGDEEVTLAFGGLLQVQGASPPSHPDTPNPWIRRARMSLELDAGGILSGRLEPDFAFTPVLFQDAWITVQPDRRLGLRVGRMDRPFGLLDALGAEEVLPIERGARFGERTTLEHYTLLESLAYAGRSLGAELRGELLSEPVLTYAFGYFRGGLGEDQGDADIHQLAGRVAVEVGRWILGAGVTHRDFEGPEGQTRWGSAAEVHLAWGAPRGEGVYVLLTGSAGVLDRFPDERYASGQLWLAWNTGRLSEHLAGLQPLLRLSAGALGGEAAEDAGLLVTPGLNALITEQGRLRLNYDVWLPWRAGEPRSTLQAQAEVVF